MGFRDAFGRRARNKRDAERVFQHFFKLTGNRAIASRYALRGLAKELERSTPSSILELGPGIGTTTYALLELNPAGRDASIWCVEEDEWCRGQLQINLEANASRVHVVESVGDLPDDAGPFDFVLVDGPGDPSWADLLAPRASVFVENHRQDQRDAMSARTNRPHVSRSRWPLPTLGRIAGYHVIQFEPTTGERLTFAIGDRFNKAVDRLKQANRKLMARVGLRRVLEWDDRRVYRDRPPPIAEELEARMRQRREEATK